MNNYRPLPENLTIKRSIIDGLGLFATENIHKGTVLGISHLLLFNKTLIRTPLGGFYNHNSINPNTEKELINEKFDSKIYQLKAIRNIRKGEEITVNYTFYNPK